jgi:hypothetical protein
MFSSGWLSSGWMTSWVDDGNDVIVLMDENILMIAFILSSRWMLTFSSGC